MPGVTRVFHLTAVVADRDAATAALARLFGVAVLHTAEDAIGGVDMKRAMLWLGDNLVEVIEPVGSSPFTSFLERFGGGMNSLGLETPDADATERRLAALGVEVAVRYGPDMYATRTGGTAGLALQWTSRHVDHDPRDTGHVPEPGNPSPVVRARRLAATLAVVPDPAGAAQLLARVLDAPARPLDDAVWTVPMGDTTLALHPCGAAEWGTPEKARFLGVALEVDDVAAATEALAAAGVATVGRNATGVVLDPRATPFVVQLC